MSSFGTFPVIFLHFWGSFEKGPHFYVTFAVTSLSVMCKQRPGPDLDPTNLRLRRYFLKVDFEKNQQTAKHEKFSTGQG